MRQLVPAFHALGDTRTPVLVSGIDLIAFVVLAVTLRGPYGHVGVSMAVAGSSAVQMVLLFVGLQWKLGTIRARELGSSAAKIAAASVIAGVAAWGAARIATGGEGPLARALPGLAGVIVFAVIYLGVVWGLGAHEVDEVTAPVKRRLAGRRRG